MPAFRRSFSFLLLVVALCACGDSKLGPDAGLGLCSDGIDNDGDGAVDYPADLGCESEEDNSEDSIPMPACSDHRDNDGDGKVDYPDDPGCLAPNVDSEEDDCPNGPSCPQCGDGKDNDGNGTKDWPEDAMGCTSAGDLLEFTDNPVACGVGLTVKMLPLGGAEMGMLMPTSTSMLSTTCGGGNGAPAIAYVFQLTEPKVIVASTDDPFTTADTVLDLRSANCTDPSASIACHDDISSTIKRSQITRALGAGTYYLIVEGKTATDMGPYSISVQFFAGPGTMCASTDDCGPGLVCRVPHGMTAMQCVPPVCNDGVDDDGDGKADFPVDPGCADPDDDEEDDDCPAGPMCPRCGNGLDDDGDGNTDFPADINCTSASYNFESCQQTEPVVVATTPVVSGTTAGMTDDYRPIAGSVNGHLCSTTATHSAPDVAIQLDLPALSALDLNLTFPGTSFDSSHTLLNASCGGAPIDCRDAAAMPLTNIAAGTYYLVVDGYSAGSGAFNLNISGTILPGESCEMPLAQSGALVCGMNTVCGGTPGSRTCIPAQCNDGIDNNSDGLMDYPADPGCTSIADDSETTVCPGPDCPACFDGIDNENDGVMDYPGDASCLSASQAFEYCPQSEPAIVATGPTTNGTTVGATNDFRPVAGSVNGHTCSTTGTHSAPDVAVEIEVPALTSLNLNMTFPGTSFDSSHTLLDSTCGGTPIDCRDAVAMPLTNIAAGKYYVIVDGYSTASGAFTLNLNGTIADGEPCDDLPLSASGALRCGPGHACKGTAGSKTCELSECNDGIDNNSDGRMDYPADPGCVDTSDDTETTVCPGASCPVCADGIDNDVDGAIDYPNDTSCVSASGTSEGCMQTEAIGTITQPQTMGTTVGATNDYRPVAGTVNGHTCSTTATHSAPDVAYQIVLPETTTLNIDITFPGTSFDSSHTLLNSTCGGAPVDCRDAPTMPFTNLPAGTYYLVVDGYSTASGAFTVNVSGTLADGESCESPLALSGALTCGEGFSCQGTLGSRTCQPSECSDGLDNNMDGTVDYPDDPGCEDPSDDSETTVCPGPMCPSCANGIDDDLDGLIDYPDDLSCFSASGHTESCNQSEPIAVIKGAVTTGTTVGATNDSIPYCGSTTHAAPDVLLELDVPDLDSLTLNVTGFDTAHSLLDSSCGDEPIFCSDPASTTTKNVRAGRYYVSIDGWGTASGAWSLATSGTVAPGGSCEGALFQAGVFTCASGLTCAGTMGSRTCQSQCSDGIDNNADGLIDFPEDPGCDSGFDVSEDLLCPGPMCPVCSNMLDDDMDSAIDWPQDNACSAASTNSETFCPIEPDVGGTITQPMTFGTLANKAANYNASCATTTANDMAYSLRLPVPVTSLTIDTLGSAAFDTVLSLKDAQCIVEYGCDDNGAFQGDNRALLKLPGLPAGNYAIQVDAKATTSNSAFVLHVSGTVAVGTACTSPLFTTGVLRCPIGSSCMAGTCQ